MNTDSLRNWEIKLGLAQMVVLVGIVTGSLVCAFIFGYLRGQEVGYEAALVATTGNLARYPVVADMEGEGPTPEQISKVYAKLNEKKATSPALDEDVQTSTFGPIKSTKEESPAQLIAKLDGSTARGSLDTEVLEEDLLVESEAKANDKLNKINKDQGLASDKKDSLLASNTSRSLSDEKQKFYDSEAGKNLAKPIQPKIGDSKTDELRLETKTQTASAYGSALKSQPEVKQPAIKVPADSNKISAELPIAPSSKTVLTKPSTGLATGLAVGSGNLATGNQNQIAKKIEPIKPVETRAELPPIDNSDLLSGWYAQVSAPKSVKEANETTAKLRKAGFPSTIERANVRGEEYYRILVGPQQTREQAEKMVSALSKQSYLPREAPFVRKVK